MARWCLAVAVGLAVLLMTASALAADLRYALDAAAWAEGLGFTPDPWQARFLASTHPREILNVTRQGGKSTATGLKIAHRTAYGRDGFTAVLAAPSERQSIELMRKVKGALWRALPPEDLVREGETHVELTRGRRVLAFPAKESTVRGPTADLLVLDEAARVSDALFGAVTPMLAVSGGSLIALSTPFGQRGFFYEEFVHGGPEWHRYQIPWQQCPRITPEFIEQERGRARRRGLDADAWIEQEYTCSFAGAVQGAYFAKLLEQARTDGRIGRVPYDARFPVRTAWDLGVSDPTSIWLYQVVGLEVRILAYYEQTGEGYAHYAGWLRQQPYHGNYAEHAWPHDGAHRSPERARPLQEAGEDAGITPIRIIPRTPDIDLDINACKALLSRCTFDEGRCAEGLKALSFYHADYDDDRRTFKPKPVHDWSSHAAAAFRTLARALEGDETTRPMPAVGEISFDVMTHDHDARRLPATGETDFDPMRGGW